MPDLLLEVLSEEIPARMQAGGAQELEKQVCSRLEDARLTFGKPERFATPRRLALLVRDLPAEQPDITIERKGPRVDAPEKAIAGFLRSTGLTLKDCEQRETPKGPVWFAVKHEKGRPTGELLTELLPQALAAVSWPKSMRWDESGVRWVRPIRSILCLLDDQVVPFHFGAIESGRTTQGHRFLEPGPHTIADAGSYEAALEGAKVMLSRAGRAIKIAGEANALAQSKALKLPRDVPLTGENAGLVEWPMVLMGSIDEHFMDLPPEVLRSAMSKHQRYFSVRGSDGKPAPHFVMVADGATDDSNDAVIAGNERVLRARLADARFFWNQDTRKPLADRVQQLEGVVFHTRLGSMKDKAERIANLARNLCIAFKDTNEDWAAGADPEQAYRAGLLCKADLVTEIVGEFPDLQGIMGRYYAEANHGAEADREPVTVSEAMAQHYAPQSPYYQLPMPPVSLAVALADKLDTLAGFFAVDERPTGSKDPFALRRAALGVIKLVIGDELRLSLREWLAKTLNGYGAMLPPEPGPNATEDALFEFFADRFKVYIRDHGFRHDQVSAVFGVDGEDDLSRIFKRVEALDRFIKSDDGANLLTAYSRAANILRIEEKKDGRSYYGRADATLFAETEERVLHTRITDALFRADAALGREDFAEAMAAMATLRKPVDAFFDHVTVNCEDPALRRNRLLMLSAIRATLDRVADFSKIEG